METKAYLGHLLAMASKALGRKASTRVREFDLTIQQFGVLNSLYEDDRLTSHELAIRLWSDSSSIMSLVDQLEKKGFLMREPGVADRRLKHLVLTDKALAIREELTRALDEFDRELGVLLTKSERRQMERALHKILDFAAQ